MFTALGAALLVRPAGAGEFEEMRFHVVPFLGRTFFDDDRRFLTGEELEDFVYYGGRVNARVSCAFLVEVAGGGTPSKTCCDWSDWGHVSGNLVWNPATDDRVSPFVSLGGGWSRWKRSLGDAQDLGTYEGALGLNVKLSDMLGLRLEARDILASSPDHFNDIVLGAGLNLGFGDVHCEEAEEVEEMAAVPAPEPPPPPAPVPVPCPDADNDGVCDDLDRCPDTPQGTPVDATGCPIAAPSQLETEMLDKGVIAVRDIYFDTGRWDIQPQSNQTLNELCTIFKQHPALQIEIGGHADARGGDAYNQDLTEKRAQAVLDWFRANCGEANLANFTAVGYGESRPIGSNSTARGMALNRRIEFKVLNPEMLRPHR
jgi:outer membrane protein OmpA-like peptidoglycan-associated protein